MIRRPPRSTQSRSSAASDVYKRQILDLATLTGACVVALGERVAGIMGNRPEWVDQVRAAADRAGEPVWSLPLPPEYRKLLDSEVADLKNVSSGGYGGCLLYTSDAADDLLCVDLGGRRIIKKKKKRRY